jgi:hypothetical protein
MCGGEIEAYGDNTSGRKEGLRRCRRAARCWPKWNAKIIHDQILTKRVTAQIMKGRVSLAVKGREGDVDSGSTSASYQQQCRVTYSKLS